MRIIQWTRKCKHLMRTQLSIINLFSCLADNYNKCANNVSFSDWLFRFVRLFLNEMQLTIWHWFLMLCKTLFILMRWIVILCSIQSCWEVHAIFIHDLLINELFFLLMFLLSQLYKEYNDAFSSICLLSSVWHWIFYSTIILLRSSWWCLFRICSKSKESSTNLNIDLEMLWIVCKRDNFVHIFR